MIRSRSTRSAALFPLLPALAKGIGSRLFFVTLLALWAAFASATPAAAAPDAVRDALVTSVAGWFSPPGPQGDLVLAAQAQGEGGLQVDAARISPAPARARLESSPGQPITPTALALPATGPLARLQLWPWPPAQGQTLVLWLRASAPLSPTITFAGQSYPLVAAEEQGGAVPAVSSRPAGGSMSAAWALVPLPSLLQPGARSLVVSTGTQTITLSVPVLAGVFESSAVPAGTSDPILSQPDKVKAESTRLALLWGTHSVPGWTPHLRFRSPLDVPGIHTSPYGSRRVYGDSASISAHEGEDLAVAAGTPVLAPADGTVVLADLLFVRGNAVILDHGHGVLTGYWHMQALNVKVGDRVRTGQQLGEVGSTGLSTGPHLHWELHVNGLAVDPLQWLQLAPDAK
jgi:murein DD-endopeptidase MepM/ murein hydrolase activator NlpD